MTARPCSKSTTSLRFSQMSQMNHANPQPPVNHLAPLNQMPQMNQPSQYPQMSHQPTSMLPPPPTKGPHSAPNSQLSSPNVSPPNSYATYSSNPGSYITRNVSGDISPAQGNYHRPMDINLLATAASQVERENTSPPHIPNQHLSLPSRTPYSTHPYHSHPYHTGRMPSLSSYHYSSNPTSQPMSRSQSHEDEDHRPNKKSRPSSPHSTAPPSPSSHTNQRHRHQITRHWRHRLTLHVCGLNTGTTVYNYRLCTIYHCSISHHQLWLQWNRQRMAISLTFQLTTAVFALARSWKLAMERSANFLYQWYLPKKIPTPRSTNWSIRRVR